MLVVTGFLFVLLLVAAYHFGPRVFAVAAVSYAVSVSIELLFVKFRGKEKLDASWMVTPLVFTMLLPSTIPLWMAGVGVGFGIFFGKSIFGGLGKTIFNPAATGVLFLLVSFTAFMTTMFEDPVTGEVSDLTPLTALYRGDVFDYGFAELFLGGVPGLMGETFRLGIIVLGLALIILKIADWRVPFAYIGTFFVLTGVLNLIFPDVFVDPLRSLVVGSLMFGAFFVATDPVTMPEAPNGRLLYGVGLGVFTIIIRTFSAFPAGLIFSVILMNAIAPLIDSWYEGKAEKTGMKEEEAKA